MHATSTANPVAEHETSIRGGFEPPLIRGSVTVLRSGYSL